MEDIHYQRAHHFLKSISLGASSAQRDTNPVLDQPISKSTLRSQSLDTPAEAWEEGAGDLERKKRALIFLSSIRLTGELLYVPVNNELFMSNPAPIRPNLKDPSRIKLRPVTSVETVPSLQLEQDSLNTKLGLRSVSEHQNVDSLTFSKPPRAATRRTEWERSLVTQGILGPQVIVRHRGAPLCLFSVIPYGSKAPVSDTFHGFDRDTLEPKRRDGVSHKALLDSPPVEYDPYFLDTSDVQSGEHRVVMNLPGFMASVISYVKDKDLKDELNAHFRVKHPWLPPNLTLSKLRKLKSLLLRVGLERELNMSTVALAYLYFEQACVGKLIDKYNRKLAGATAMLLAYKFNERSGPVGREELVFLFESMQKLLGVRKVDVLQYEIHMFCALRFDLHVTPERLQPHIEHFSRMADV